MARKLPSCFAIMPFGPKRVGAEIFDFDLVWKRLICPAAISAGFEAYRVDEELKNGVISEAMLRHIIDADVVVADVTYHNPNVYYELGVRHALSRHGTVLIKRSGGSLGVSRPPRFAPERIENSDIPFDVRGLTHHWYNLTEATVESEVAKLERLIRARYNAERPDSLVYSTLPSLRVRIDSPKASGRKDRRYHILDASGRRVGKTIGYRSGDIANLDAESGIAVDYWANSENTLMQMARIHERAISATVRYLSGCDPDTRIVDDCVQTELTRALGNRQSADEAEVLITDSGHLRRTHNVKALLHVAAVTGTAREGFRPVSDEKTLDCVRNTISAARKLIREGKSEISGGRSLIMPIFGAGQARRDPSSFAGQMVYAAIECLRAVPEGQGEHDLDAVYFAAFTEDDVKLMRRTFEALKEDGDLEATSG